MTDIDESKRNKKLTGEKVNAETPELSPETADSAKTESVSGQTQPAAQTPGEQTQPASEDDYINPLDGKAYVYEGGPVTGVAGKKEPDMSGYSYGGFPSAPAGQKWHGTIGSDGRVSVNYTDDSGYTVRGATDKSDYINRVYDAGEKAATAALESAYQDALAENERAAGEIPEYYREAARRVSAQISRSRQNMNEQLTALGLNTGTYGQAALAQDNVLQGQLGQLQQARAEAQKEFELERQKLTNDYRRQCMEAVLNNDLERAKALYNEAVRVDQSLSEAAYRQLQLDLKLEEKEENRQLQAAQLLAQTAGDYSALCKFYGLNDRQTAEINRALGAIVSGHTSSGGTKTEKETGAELEEYLNSLVNNYGFSEDMVKDIYLAYLRNRGIKLPSPKNIAFNKWAAEN